MIEVEKNEIKPLLRSEAVLQGTVDRYGLENIMFVSSKSLAIEDATQVLETYDYDHDSLESNPEVYIELLAIIDSTFGYKIRPGVRDILLSELGFTQKNENGISSNDTRCKQQPQFSEESIDKWRGRFSMPLESTLHKARIIDRSNSSFLLPVRRELDLKSELDFDIEVFDVDSDSFSVHFGAEAFVMYPRGRGVIFLPRDASDTFISHEWIHTQLLFLRRGKNAAFYTGLNEAMVESHSLIPYYYLPQREVFDRLVADLGEDFKKTVISAAGGDNDANFEMRRRLVERYSLSGLLAIMRMAPLNNFKDAKFYTPAQKRIFCETDSVKKTLQGYTADV